MSGNGVTPAPSLARTLQIIVGAMTGGCVLFLVVALVVGGAPGNSPDPPMLTYVALAVAAGAVAARAIVPGMVVVQARRKIGDGTWKAACESLPRYVESTQSDDARKLAQVLMMRTIVAAAILEGATFFLLIAQMVEHSPVSLIVAVLLIVALLFHIPTRSGVDRWLEDQLQLLNAERPF